MRFNLGASFVGWEVHRHDFLAALAVVDAEQPADAIQALIRKRVGLMLDIG